VYGNSHVNVRRVKLEFTLGILDAETVRKLNLGPPSAGESARLRMKKAFLARQPRDLFVQQSVQEGSEVAFLGRRANS